MKRLFGSFSDSPKSGKTSPTQKESPKGSPKISPKQKESPKGSPKISPKQKDIKRGSAILKEDVKGFFSTYAKNINQLSYKAILDRIEQQTNILADNTSRITMDGLRQLIIEEDKEVEKLIKSKDPIPLKTFINKHLNQNRLIILYQQRRILKGKRKEHGKDNHYFAAIGAGDIVYVIQGNNVDSMKREELADVIINIASGKVNGEKRKYKFTLYAYNRKVLHPDIITEYLKT